MLQMRSGRGLVGGIGCAIGAFSDSIAAASRSTFGVGLVRWILDFAGGFETEERRRARSEVGRGHALTASSDSGCIPPQLALSLLLSFLDLAMLVRDVAEDAILLGILPFSNVYRILQSLNAFVKAR